MKKQILNILEIFALYYLKHKESIDDAEIEAAAFAARLILDDERPEWRDKIE